MQWQTLLEGGSGGGSISGSVGVNTAMLDRLGSDNGSQVARRGQTFLHSTFDGGNFDGWNNHYSGTIVSPPVGMTQVVSWGSSHSLVLQPQVRDGLARNKNTSVYKRLSRPLDDGLGLVSFSALVAVSGDSSPAKKLPFSEWGMGIDSQRWDNSSRMFHKLNLVDTSPSTDAYQAAWHLHGYDIPAGEPDTWGPGDRTGSVHIPIPGSVNVHAGLNERKLNPNYLRLTVDFDADDGLGRAVEAQINDKVFDLSGLMPANKLPWDNVLKGDSMDDFRGGFNFGFFCRARSDRASRVQLAIGQVRVTVGDQRA